MSTNSKDFRVWIALGSFAILAGCAFLFVKVLVGELTPLQLVAARSLTAAIAVGALMLVTRSRVPLTRAYLRGAGQLAFLDGLIPYVLVAWAEIHVTSGVAAVLVGTMPLFTTLFAGISGEQESIGGGIIAGLLAGFIGVAVLADLSTVLKGGSDAAGILAVLGAAACYAAAAVRARPLVRSTNAIGLTGTKLILTAIAVTPIALLLDGGSAYGSLSLKAVGALVALGFGSTGLGRCAYLWAVGRAGSVRASTVTYVSPVIAIFLGWLILDEPVGLSTFAGTTLVISGVGFVAFGSAVSRWWSTTLDAAQTHLPGAMRVSKPGTATERL